MSKTNVKVLSIAERVLSLAEALDQNYIPGAAQPLSQQDGNGNLGRGQGDQGFVINPPTPDGREHVPKDGSGYYQLMIGPNNMAEVFLGPFFTYVEALTSSSKAGKIVSYYDAKSGNWFDVDENGKSIANTYNVINRSNDTLPKMEFGPTPVNAVYNGPNTSPDVPAKVTESSKKFSQKEILTKLEEFCQDRDFIDSIKLSLEELNDVELLDNKFDVTDIRAACTRALAKTGSHLSTFQDGFGRGYESSSALSKGLTKFVDDKFK